MVEYTKTTDTATKSISYKALPNGSDGMQYDYELSDISSSASSSADFDGINSNVHIDSIGSGAGTMDETY